MLLVRAEMTLADGSMLPGFVIPDPGGTGDMGTTQPHLFIPDGKLHGFWTVIIRSTSATRSRFYASLVREPSVFPIRGIDGRIDGFLSSAKLGSALVVLDR